MSAAASGGAKCPVCGGWAVLGGDGILLPHQRWADGAGPGASVPHDLEPCEGRRPLGRGPQFLARFLKTVLHLFRLPQSPAAGQEEHGSHTGTEHGQHENMSEHGGTT